MSCARVQKKKKNKYPEAAKNGSWPCKCKGLWTSRPQTCSSVLQHDDEKTTVGLMQDEKRNDGKKTQMRRERGRREEGKQSSQFLAQNNNF